VDWKQVTENLRALAGDEWLPARVRERIASLDNRFIACSGGADSVFLALAFGSSTQSKPGEAPITVLHFNHKLRGESSDGDERFTRELCESLGIAFQTESWQRSDEAKPVSEEAARDARMSFFARALEARPGESAILTGHHADDIAETLLMRLSRGSGLQGLTAPREVSVGANGLKFIRPLLALSKQDIVSRLEKAGASWREDASNHEAIYYRNRLRQSVIPEWEKAADRPLRGGIVQSRALLEEDWQALEQVFDARWRETVLESGALDWQRVLAMPKAFQRRALNRLVSESGSSILTLAAMEGALEFLRLETSFKISLEKGVWLAGSAVSGRVERLESKSVPVWARVRLPLDVELHLPCAGSIRAREVLLDAEKVARIRSGAFSHERSVFIAVSPSARLWVRSWRAGDAYRPMGRQSFVKLKELFGARKVPREERVLLPIVTDSEDRILWTPGLPPSWDCQVGKETTRALQLTYEK